MNFRLLFFAGVLLLTACTKASGPLKLYFIASTRFTSGNRTVALPGDTLATRLFAVADSAGGNPLQNVRVTVTYTPTRQSFVYPTPITAFVYGNVPSGEQVVYLDSTFVQPQPGSFLLTSVFGARTTTGSERWEYTATDKAGNTSTRSFVAVLRRSDSTAIYQSYTLRLNVPTRGVSARRFIQFRSGLALPAYTVLGTAGTAPTQQGLTDLVQSPDGLSLFAPDMLPQASTTRWPLSLRRKTRFSLTALDVSGFGSQADTTAIRQLFTYPGQGVLSNLTVNQVYAFRTYPLPSSGERSTFGLLRVASVPGGTAPGLQLEVRLAKLPL